MQKNASSKKNELKPIYKPYLRGKAVSGTAAKRGWRVLGYILMFTFLCFIVGNMLPSSSAALRVILNGLLVAACCALMMSEGSRQGEADVAFAEIAQGRLDSGKPVPESEKDTCFHPLKGFFTAAVGVAVIFVLAVVFSLIAHPQSYQLGALPGWVAAYTSQAEISGGLAFYNDMSGLGVEGILRIVMRILMFPYVNMVNAGDHRILYLVEKLMPLLCLIVPVFYGIGYLRGPYLRALVHGNIRMNRRRYNRKERKAREKRAQRGNEKKELI